ncbi:glycosyltransferase family 4 protein [Vibrio vulnificus]
MKIVHFVHSYNGFSGATKQAINLAKHIEVISNSKQVFLTLNTTGYHNNSTVKNGFIVYFSRLGAFRKLIDYVSFILKENPDVIHFHGADFLLLVICKIFRKRVYWKSTLFNSDDFISLTNSRFGFIKKYLIKLIDVNNTLTQQIYNSNSLILNERKLVTIPNGVNIPDNLDFEKEKIALIVSALLPRKRVFEGIGFYNEYLSGNGFKLYVIGPSHDGLDGFCSDYADRCLDLAKEDVIFLGELDSKSLSKYFEKASVLIHFSEYEGLPNVVLEAMSYQIFPVVSSMNGLAEEIIDEDTGFNVDGSVEFDYSQIKIPNLLGQKKVIENNSFDIVARKTHTIYERLKKVV